MQLPKSFATIAPFCLILIGSLILFSLRFFEPLQFYEKNLIMAIPILGTLYILSAFYFLIFREKVGLDEIGLYPEKEQFTFSIILGLLAGIFFFMIYIGAHPNRMMPPLGNLIRFNLYFLFCALSEEMIFRVWIVHSLKKLFRTGHLILISSLVYTFASLATIGKDSATALTGQINEFLIVETLFHSFWVGLILTCIYFKTKSIYGNLLFVFISSIPQLYEVDGLVHKDNPISVYIAVFGLLLFLILVIFSKLIKRSSPLSELRLKKIYREHKSGSNDM